jgi:PPK2 family polyphosphate:nucleotide phosphotransferase
MGMLQGLHGFITAGIVGAAGIDVCTLAHQSPVPVSCYAWALLKGTLIATRRTMDIDSKRFRVAEGARVDLKRWLTRADPVYRSEEHYARLLREHIKALSEQQRLLYASNRHAVLLIFQAMDAAGKDGAIAHVMSGVNPQGCQVFSYRHPSAIELQHDFLWRTNRDLPERGKIGIFNRSYYEEVLIVRVHPEILRGEGLPYPRDLKALWNERYRSIRAVERHLHANDTRIVKFFLHVSKDEQRKRFLQRIDDEDKNWKFSSADMEERKYWSDYRKAYEKCLSATSTKESPWYVIPADDKLNAHLLVSRVVLDTIERLRLEYPKVSPKQRRELQELRKRLVKS